MSQLSDPTIMSQVSFQPPDQPLPDKPIRNFIIAVILNLTYVVFRLVLAIAVMIIVASVSFDGLKESDGYGRSQENLSLWEREMIVDLRVTQGYNCPQGYEQYTDSEWSGNYIGCHCTLEVGIYEFDAVLEGACSEDEFRRQCTSIPSHEAIYYTYWKANTHLCVKREPNLLFYTQAEHIEITGNHTRVKCAEGANYQIDLIDAIPCPVTDMIEGDSLPETLTQLSFSFMRQNHYPIVGFKVQEHSFCHDWSKHSISPKRQHNYILQYVTKQPCSQTDPRFIILASQTEPSLIDNNPRIKEAISRLPAYPPPDQHYSYFLGYVRYPAWTYNCRQDETYNLIQVKQQLTLEKSSRISDGQGVIYGCGGIWIVYLILFVVGIWVHQSAKQAQGYLYLKDVEVRRVNPRSNIPKDLSWQIIKWVTLQFVNVTVVVALSVISTYAKEEYDWFKGASVCTEQPFIGYLKEYERFYGSAMVSFTTAIFLTVGMILVDICHLVWRLWDGDLQQYIPEKASKSQKTLTLTKDTLNFTKQCLVENASNTDTDNQMSIISNSIPLFQIQQESSEQSSEDESQSQQ